MPDVSDRFPQNNHDRDDTGFGRWIRALCVVFIALPVALAGLLLAGARHGLFGMESAVALFAISQALLNGALIAVTAMLLRRNDQRRRGIEEANARLAAIVAHSDDAILSEDLQGRIISWNRGAERLFGYTSADAIGRPVTMLAPPDGRHEAAELLERVKRGEHVSRFQTVRVRRDGQPLDVSLTLSPMKDHRGRLIGVSKIARDVSAQMRMSAALEAARDTAEAASRSKSAFLANMSHEIRTPMTAVIGYAELLLDARQSPSDRLECIEGIRFNAHHLLGVINDILDLSKIEAGEMRIERVQLSPCSILSEVASTMRVQATKRGLRLEIETFPPIPATIEGDPTCLRQILINLLGNAVKFTEQGSVRLMMRLLEPTDQTRPLLQFQVIDTGIGIDHEEISKLFRPFVQADASTTRRFGGTGLGLTISRRLAQMLGGDISVESAPGVGSTFTLAIDPGTLEGVEWLQDCSEASHERRRSTATVPPRRLEGRVLLVDDGIHNQRVLSAFLQQAGAHVTVADNGRAGSDVALKAAAEGTPFEVVLMDMQMPELDGYAATSRLRQKGYEGPIIALTAHAMAEDRDKCLRAGCDDYLAKPVTREMLLEAVSRHLTQRHMRPNEPETLLRSTATDPAVCQFLPAFIADLPRQVSGICASLDTKDLPALRKQIHDLKGTGGLYGFMSISIQAADVEIAIDRDDPLDTIASEVNALLTLLRRVEGYDIGQERAT